MDINSLKEIVGGALVDKKFALLTDKLQSAAATRISDDFLPDKTLRLDGASTAETADAITVRGKGVDLPFKGLAVELSFYIEAGDAAFNLTATGDAKWTLAKGFPPFAGTLAEYLRFAGNQPPQLFLRTHANADGPRDLSFAGVLDLKAMTKGMASFIGRESQPISGPIVLKEEGSKFYGVDLVAPDSSSVNLGIATVKKLTFRIGSELRSYDAEKKYVQPFIELTADIPFGKSGSKEISISARATDLNSGFRFQADLSAAIDTAIDELMSLTNGHGMDGMLPDPSRFQLSRVLKLNEFFFDFELASKKVTFIGVGMQNGQPWQILHIDETGKNLQVKNVQVLFVVDDPFGDANKSLTISGDFAFDQVEVVQATMRYPDWAIHASLKENTTLSLKDTVGVFKNSTDQVPEMDVYQLELSVSLKGFALNLELDGELLIPDIPFGLQRAGVSIDSASSTFSFRGVLIVAGIFVTLTADYPGRGAGWQFEGSIPGQELPIGHLIQGLAEKFGEIKMPSAIDSLVIENLATTFKTATKEFTFGCEGKFRAHDTDVKLKVDLAIEKKNETYSRMLTGKLWAGELEFTLHFAKVQGVSDSFVAIYQPKTKGKTLDVRQLVASVSAGVANYVPAGLDVELKDVIIACRKSTQDGTNLMFGLSLGTGINLSNLPLVGQKLPPEATIAVENLQVIFNSKELTKQEVDNFNSVIPEGITRLPVPAKADEQEAPRLLTGTVAMEVLTTEPVVIEKGFVVSALMNFGGTQKFFCLSGVRREPRLSVGTDTVSANAPAADNVKWFPLQKTFGPVYFDKVGVQYEAATLRFLMNAALSAAGLTLSLEGLSVGSSLRKFDPKFELRGLGIDYKNDAVEIGGAFLRTVTEGKADSYDGAAVIKTKQFAVSALGSYTTLDGEPSLFIYAFVDYPLGGPAFFFITGLAAGFGYNRKLIAPSVEKVAEFPLVKQAVGTQPKPKDVMEALRSLQSSVPPNIGSIFLAVGVRFNSFKLVDSFALLTIEFGNSLAINLIGVSKAVVPKVAGSNVTPLAQVEIAWKATFNPDDGCLGIDARLTPNSYILSKDCRLSGGYAFYSWFTGPHAGDFVQTLGGYHPKFDVPDHYPKVPRLAFDWRVSNSLTIQGDAYYALTGSALMAGGHLEVLFREGELRAWLKLGADFLIAWKPYHYDASIYVNVGASYTFNINLLFTRVRVTISVDVGAQLHLWGPDFSGTARIDLSVISFTIAFGARASQTPEPLKKWSDFQDSFLPKRENMCTISVKDGLVRSIEGKGKESWVINPKELSLVIDSAIPLKSAGDVAESFSNVNFGIAPMAKDKSKFKNSTMKVTVTRSGTVGAVNNNFKLTLIKKLVPAGLWGESATPSLTGQRFLEDVATGIEIAPAAPPVSGESKKIDIKVFEFEPERQANAFKWEQASKFEPADVKDSKERRNRIADRVGSNEKRDALLAELKLGKFGISIGKTVAGDFLTAPQIGTFELCQPK